MRLPKLKRANKLLIVHLAVNDLRTAACFERSGKLYNKLYNSYLDNQAIQMPDIAWIASLASMNAKKTGLRLHLPVYDIDPRVQYLGNLPIKTAEFSGPHQTAKQIQIQDIGGFDIRGSNKGDVDETMLQLKKIMQLHRKHNSHLPATTEYSLDYLTTSGLHIASVHSTPFPQKYDGATHILYINY